MSYPTPPSLLPVDENGLPTMLRERCIWVVWRLTWNAYQQCWTKAPYKPIDDGFSPFASPSNPNYRWPLELCLDVVHKGGADGVGIVTGNGLVAIDLDNCFYPDGSLKVWAYQVVRRLNTYTELSPSGHGLHLVAFCQVALPNRDLTLPDGKIQFFANNHFLTLTGHITGRWCARGDDVEGRTQEVLTWHNETWPTAQATGAPLLSSTGGGSVDDADLLDAMFAAKNGAQIRRLYEGDITDYPSHSEADQALMNHLAFWTNKDASQMRRLFEQSKLYRSGQKSNSYVADTIAKAILSTPNGYQPSSLNRAAALRSALS